MERRCASATTVAESPLAAKGARRAKEARQDTREEKPMSARTYRYTDQWGETRGVRLMRCAFADGSLAVLMLSEQDGEWEEYGDVTVNLGDLHRQTRIPDQR